MAERLLTQWSELSSRDQETIPAQGFDQSKLELSKAGYRLPER